MGFHASHKYARISARKVRPVADLVRGMNVNRALEALEFNPRRGAFLFKMVIRSALANAAQDSATNVNDLVVDRIYVDDGPLLHRPLGRFVARGRWHPIRKRTSHLHVVLEPPRASRSDAEHAESSGEKA
jgi:large subunit ribosomal protein L22